MYTPRYLKYLRFSEAFGIAMLKTKYRQKCHVICRVDHDALREITRYSNPPYSGYILCHVPFTAPSMESMQTMYTDFQCFSSDSICCV